MKVFTLLFALMLFFAATLGSYGFAYANNTGHKQMKMDCKKSCCEKMHKQQKPTESKKHNCCNNSICSPLASCNFFVHSNHASLIKNFAIITAKPSLVAQSFILNNFINAVFQPPEAKPNLGILPS